jgi:hypothetical protein
VCGNRFPDRSFGEADERGSGTVKQITVANRKSGDIRDHRGLCKGFAALGESEQGAVVVCRSGILAVFAKRLGKDSHAAAADQAIVPTVIVIQ